MRYRNQDARKSVYLLAWLEGVPVGHFDLRWPRDDGSALRRYLPDCPELNAIVVLPALRSMGIGAALIGAAERPAAERGSPIACLGVSIEKQRARGG